MTRTIPFALLQKEQKEHELIHVLSKKDKKSKRKGKKNRAPEIIIIRVSSSPIQKKKPNQATTQSKQREKRDISD